MHPPLLLRVRPPAVWLRSGCCAGLTFLAVLAGGGSATAAGPPTVVPGAVPPLSPLRVVHPFSAVGRYAAGDRGVDLAGTPGETVVSATAGVVFFAGAVADQGVVSVRIVGGALLTYEPVAPSVTAGESVIAGSVLGHLDGGHLGCPAVACLHWGLREADGTYADPLALLGPVQVRLLPIPLGGPRPGAFALVDGSARVLTPAVRPPRPVSVSSPDPGPHPPDGTAGVVATGVVASGVAAGVVGAPAVRRRRSRRRAGVAADGRMGS